MRLLYFKLDENNKPVPCDDMDEWARFMSEKQVRLTKRTPLANDGKVSTVFLGLSHGTDRFGAHYLWETMVFADGTSHGTGPGVDGAMNRYTSHEAALAGHDAMVEMVYRDEPSLRLEA